MKYKEERDQKELVWQIFFFGMCQSLGKELILLTEIFI